MSGARVTGSQTLARGLDILEAVADGVLSLADLADHVGLTRSTTYRLATALVERRYLSTAPRAGYTLGPKLMELGFVAHRDVDLVQIARPLLETLSADTSDTVHLGVVEGDRALYLDKISGRRRINISSRVGERQPLTTTGLGKALLLGLGEERWKEIFWGEPEADPARLGDWLGRMRAYAKAGHAFDLEENEDRIRCVAAPIREAGGRVVAAISVSSATQYMDDARMAALSGPVRDTADRIGALLGWSGAEREGAENAA